MNIPLVLNNFNLYTGDKGDVLAGIGTVELPEIETPTTEVNIAGVSGALEVPLTGHTNAMTVTVNAPVLTIQALKALNPDPQIITARGAIEQIDTRSSAKRIVNLIVTMRCKAKGFKAGNMEKAAAMDTSLPFAVDYLKIQMDGKTYLEIDKLNNKYVVDGVDHLSGIRNAI